MVKENLLEDHFCTRNTTVVMTMAITEVAQAKP